MKAKSQFLREACRMSSIWDYGLRFAQVLGVLIVSSISCSTAAEVEARLDCEYVEAGNGAERVTESDVKRIFSEAIKSAGYRIDDNTLATIDVDVNQIAKALNDAKSTTIHVDESKGYKEGFYYCLYSNGKLQGAGYYCQGKRIGPCRIYHPNGQLSLSLQYDDQGREQG